MTNLYLWGGLSGGIDSQAAALLMREKYGEENVILLNSNAGGWEHPLTTEHVQWYSEHIHPVVPVFAKVSDLWVTEGFAETKGLDGEQQLTMELLIQLKGRAPSRTRQFCTYFLKLIPMKRWQEENLRGKEFARFTGIRRDESDARKNTPDREWDEFFDCEIFHVVAGWTKEQCFDFVKSRGERINPLYLEGFTRVGCAPCINEQKEGFLLWSQRHPDVIEKVRAVEQQTGVTFIAPCVPGMTMNFIDDVVQWSQTDRGGRQANMFKILNTRPACESKYGLCE